MQECDVHLCWASITLGNRDMNDVGYLRDSIVVCYPATQQGPAALLAHLSSGTPGDKTRDL